MNKYYIVNIPLQDYPECINNIIEKYTYTIESDYQCRVINCYFDSKNKQKKFVNEFDEFYNCK